MLAQTARSAGDQRRAALKRKKCRYVHFVLPYRPAIWPCALDRVLASPVMGATIAYSPQKGHV